MASQILDTHVVLCGPDGTFVPSGAQVTRGPVTSVEKLAQLITWAAKQGQLQPITLPGGRVQPGQVRFLDAAVEALTAAQPPGELNDQVGAALAPLIARGWTLSGTGDRRFELGTERPGAADLVVEVLIEPKPWLAPASEGQCDAGEVSRRMIAWAAALKALPGVTAAESAASVQDSIMAARKPTAERDQRKDSSSKDAAIATVCGLLPDDIAPALVSQPPWTAPAGQLQDHFEADVLVWLEQECPELATVGTITLGYGTPRRISGDAARAEASLSKDRRFALWHSLLPAFCEIGLPDTVPAPHPMMQPDQQVRAWLTTEDLVWLCKAVRDGGAGVTIEQLNITEALIWPKQARLLEAWKKKFVEARDSFVDDIAMRSLVELAAREYVASLADVDRWPSTSVHLQTAWLASIYASIRYRSRRAMMRLSREYHVWPLYVSGAGLLYALKFDEKTGRPVDLSDLSSTNLGRLQAIKEIPIDADLILTAFDTAEPSELIAVLSDTIGVEHPATPSGQPVPAAPEKLPAEPSPASDANSSIEDVTTAEQDHANEPAEPKSAEASPPSARPKPGNRRKSKAEKKAEIPEQDRIPAAVLHTDGLWLPDGTHIEITEPIEHVGQVAELAYTFGIGYHLRPNYAEHAQIWITEAACRVFGVDTTAIDHRKSHDSLQDITLGIEFVTKAAAEGWRFGGAKEPEDPEGWRLGTWTRVYHKSDDKPQAGDHSRNNHKRRRGVQIALIPGMAAELETTDEQDEEEALRDEEQLNKTVPILAGNPTPAAIARRLKLLADALDYPWKINGGVTGIDLMLEARPSTWDHDKWRNVVFAPSTTPAPYGILDIERDFYWSRIPTEQEQTCLYVHAYDRGASYPAAIPGLYLPIGDPVHHPEGTPFVKGMPAYYRAEIPENGDWRIPYLLNPKDLAFSEPKWVTSPRVEQAIAMGYQPTIVEALVWPERSRAVLEEWYKRVHHASIVLDTEDPDAQAARKQSKVIRTTTIGLMGSTRFLKGRTGFDPLRRFMIEGKANSNLIYGIQKIGDNTGRFPVAVVTDTVVYASDEPDPVKAWPGAKEKYGSGFGQFKHEGSALLADHLEFLTGNGYRGKKALIPAQKWREMLPELAAQTAEKERIVDGSRRQR